MAKRPGNASPQVGVRFKEDEMARLRERAERDFAGNVSTLVKVAVRRLLGERDANDGAEAEKPAVAA
jgi:hypothetical protein